MKKNKVYLFISIITLLCLFGTAALCNQLGTTESLLSEEEEPLEEEEAQEEEEIEEESPKEKPPEEEPLEEDEAQEEETEEETPEPDEQKEAPTIALEIYEGPVYSSADDVCYYRIEATITGSPTPSVEFSKDDSNGAWGSKKAQVNLYDPSETYTLTATATNSEGSATDTIDLSWGCPIPITPPEVTEIEVPIDESATIIENFFINDAFVVIGDQAGNKTSRGFVSFNITDLAETTINDATLGFVDFYESGDPYDQLIEAFWVKVVDWGDDALVLSDYDLPSKPLGEYPDPIIIIDNQALKDALQIAISNGKKRFQIMISHKGWQTNNNNTNDFIRYYENDIYLNVKYTEP